MNIDLLLAQAVSAFLLSWWKPLLMLLPIGAWAWLVSSKLDKDARYFHLKPQMWNSIHLAAGVAAVAAMLFIPIFWIGWPAGMIILLGPVLAYWYIRNQNVPEDRKFMITGQSLSETLAARRQARASKQALLQFSDSRKNERATPLKEDPLFAVHMTAEDVLGPAMAARASKVELVAAANGAVVAQVVDGIKYKRQVLAPDAAVKLIDYIKDLAGLDVNDRRRKQRGVFTVKSPESQSEITAITTGSSSGQKLEIYFDLNKRLHKPFDGLGLLPQQFEALRAMEQIHERHGVILLGAPPGHGLSTTAYSFLARHDAYTSNVKSLEREIQVQLLGVDQVQWDASNPDIDYATNLQSILRRDPDIVLVDEARDRETAQVAAEPGMQGPLIYVQQPLPTVVDQIRDWVKKVGDVKQATRGLRAVTNQRLLRSLCPNCRQAFQPSPEQLKRLNLSSKKVTQLHRASGKVQVKNRIEDCRVCNGTGYLGQTAAFEVMIVDDECRKLLSGGDLKAALVHARRNNMMTVQEAALAKVVNGETDLDEVVRVTAPAAPKPAARSGGSAPASPPPQPTPAS